MIEGTFDKGTYIVFLDIGWSANKLDAESITISAYSSG